MAAVISDVIQKYEAHQIIFLENYSDPETDIEVSKFYEILAPLHGPSPAVTKPEFKKV